MTHSSGTVRHPRWRTHRNLYDFAQTAGNVTIRYLIIANFEASGENNGLESSTTRRPSVVIHASHREEGTFRMKRLAFLTAGAVAAGLTACTSSAPSAIPTSSPAATSSAVAAECRQ
jgi:hypothetical protein